MIVLMILLGSVLFYLCLYGYLYLNVNKLRGRMPLRIVSWLTFAFLLMVLVLAGMAIIQQNFPEYHKALAILPIVFGFTLSILRNRDLWKQIQNSDLPK